MTIDTFIYSGLRGSFVGSVLYFLGVMLSYSSFSEFFTSLEKIRLSGIFGFFIMYFFLFVICFSWFFGIAGVVAEILVERNEKKKFSVNLNILFLALGLIPSSPFFFSAISGKDYSQSSGYLGFLSPLSSGIVMFITGVIVCFMVKRRHEEKSKSFIK